MPSPVSVFGAFRKIALAGLWWDAQKAAHDPQRLAEFQTLRAWKSRALCTRPLCEARTERHE